MWGEVKEGVRGVRKCEVSVKKSGETCQVSVGVVDRDFG